MPPETSEARPPRGTMVVDQGGLGDQGGQGTKNSPFGEKAKASGVSLCRPKRRSRRPVETS